MVAHIKPSRSFSNELLQYYRQQGPTLCNLKNLDWKQAAIAQALGLTPGWVSRTLKPYREQGQTALLWRKRTGAPTRLSADQLTQLVGELNKGAKYHGFPGHIWTRPRVNEPGCRSSH